MTVLRSAGEPGKASPITWWRTHRKVHAQARAREDRCRLIKAFTEGLGGARSMRRAEGSQGDMQLAVGEAAEV